MPGPAEFVDNIEYAVRDGANVIVRFPLGAPQGLSHNLRNRLQTLFDWTHLDAKYAEDDLIGFLYNQICPQLRSHQQSGIATLAKLPDFQGRLIWIEDVDSVGWKNWSNLLQAYSDICRNIDLARRSSFVVVLNGELVITPIIEEVTLVHHDFRGAVDELDLFIFALHNMPRNRFLGHHRALLANVVASLSKWDIILAERMIQSSSEELLRPHTTLQEYAAEHTWTSETPRKWEYGTLDGTDGQHVHSALLQMCVDRHIVKQRLWAAQAAVLLPIVEERRVRFIEKYKHHLCLPVETKQGLTENPLDLSIGQLAWQLERHGVPAHLRKYVRRLKRLRNALAHMEPLSAKDAMHRSLFDIP